MASAAGATTLGCTNKSDPIGRDEKYAKETIKRETVYVGYVGIELASCA